MGVFFCSHFSIYSVRTVSLYGLIERRRAQCAVHRSAQKLQRGEMVPVVATYSGTEEFSQTRVWKPFHKHWCRLFATKIDSERTFSRANVFDFLRCDHVVATDSDIGLV